MQIHLNKLTIAMPKGRIFQEALELLRKSGFPLPEAFDENRKLVLELPEAGFSFILAKPMDVPTYVAYGVADVGVVGKDVLLEEQKDVYELLDLGIGRCRMAVASLPNYEAKLEVMPRIATKYPNLAANYFREKGQQVEIIKLNGSVELAPILGLADRVVDIVSTGTTLKENGLIERETIMPITTRLIANRVSYRLKSELIDLLVSKLEEVVK